MCYARLYIMAQEADLECRDTNLADRHSDRAWLRVFAQALSAEGIGASSPTLTYQSTPPCIDATHTDTKIQNPMPNKMLNR